MAKLSINEAAACGYTDVRVIGFQELIDTGTGNQITIGQIPAGGSMALVSVIESVAFAGSTTLVIDIGVTGADPDEFIDALDVDAMTTGSAVHNTGDAMTQAAGTTTALGGYLPVSGTAAAQDVLLEVNDAALASLTAGELVIGMKINDLAQFSSANNG